MGNFWQDLRYGARMLARRPGFTLVAVAALALGIGANSAIFSVVNGVMLKPLPFDGAERLLAVSVRAANDGDPIWDHSYPNFTDIRDRSETLEGAAAYYPAATFLTGGEEPELVRGAMTTADLFPMLGAQAAMGRTFTREDDQTGARRVALLSHGFWERRYGANPDIVGQEIMLGSRPTLVLGVMPKGFKFPVQTNNVDWWMPLGPALTERERDGRGIVFMRLIAKRKEGVSLEQAQAELATISKRLEAQYATTNTGVTFGFTPFHTRLVGDLRLALWVLLGAVGCVLLIACANVANLLLARAAARYKEISIRTALGASRWRIMRQLLTESVLLATLGGLFGLLLAWWGTDLLVAASPADLPRAAEIALDWRVLIFTAALSLLTGVVFGLAPALQASKSEITESLKEGGRGSTEGGRSRLRGALVVAEVAVSLVLLVGAGLLVQSFMRLMNVSPGFDPEGVLAADITFRGERAKDPVQQVAAAEEIIERASQLAGVESVAAVDPVPMGGSFIAFSFQIEGRAPFEPGQVPNADRRVITPNYFKTMRIPVRSGRAFDERDRADAPPVCIINENFARRHFGGEDPVGQRITTDETPDERPREIVGVVGDVRHGGLEEETSPEYYVPLAQRPVPRVTLMARTSGGGDPSALVPSLRGIIRQVDKEIPLYRIHTMEELLSDSVARRRFSMMLLGGFALVALLLAGLGIYGVMSYSVAQRTHEIGIRMALGAQARDVLKMVIGQGMLLAGGGVLAGLVAAVILTRVMSSLLYGVSATDPMTFGGVAAVLTFVALLSCYLPARRATKVDPMVALRYE
ncbi:MAG TPA: ABC transporter permease [Pyrinomonadaceae bacterium]|nr:ABC transporter permease [Pyrinomonadaceae bacterium]